jgi:hypothetical protein
MEELIFVPEVNIRPFSYSLIKAPVIGVAHAIILRAETYPKGPGTEPGGTEKLKSLTPQSQTVPVG